MKIACINISSDILIGKTQDDNVPHLSRLLLSCGVNFSSIFIVNNNENDIIDVLNGLSNDIVIILGENSAIKNFSIKNTLANFWRENIVKSSHLESAVTTYLKQENITISQVENEYFIPEHSIPLINTASYLQGFMYDGGNTTFVFIPNDIDSINYLFNNAILPLITRQRRVAYENLTIKTFGINEIEINKLLSDLLNNDYKITINTFPDGLDVAVNIRYNSLTPNEIINVFVSKVYEKLRKYIYADGEVTLYQMALDLLTLSNKTIAIAETITGGNICNEFNKCVSPSKSLLLEGRILNTQLNNKSILNLNSAVLNRYGNISVETAYEMATTLLETANSDLVLVTCGDIDGDKNVCYLAVGDADGIHVYKNTYSGNKDKVISTVSKCGVFYLIKKLKQNDLFFNTITV